LSLPKNNNETGHTQALLASDAFRHCPRQALARLVPHLRERHLADGEMLFDQGQEAAHAYLLLGGQLVLAERRGRHLTHREGLAAEEAALGVERYAASATADGETRVLEIPAAPLRALVDQCQGLRDRLLQRFAHRFSRREASAEAVVEAPSSGRPAIAVIGWLLALLAPAAVYLLLRDTLGADNPHGLYFLMVGVATVVMWVFQLLPEFVPALFALLGVILLGLAPPAVALSGFASKGFFIALSIFGLSVVIRSSGLSYRLLLWLLRIGPSRQYWYGLSLLLTGFALTPVVPSTNGRVAITAPLLSDLLGALGDGCSARGRQRLAVIALMGVSLLSPIFLSSKSVNFLVFGFLPAQEQARFQWLEWLHAAALPGVLIAGVFLVAVALIFRDRGDARLPKPVVQAQLALLGPVSRSEWAAILGLGVLTLSFLTTAIHRIPIPWVALAILFWLLMFGMLDRRQFREQIDWTFLIFLGALIGIVATMRRLHLDAWLIQQFSALGTYMGSDFALFVALLAGAMFVVRLALPINATVVVFAAILMPYAEAIGVNSWLVGFLILFFAESFFLPYQASYYMLFRSSTGLADPARDWRVAFVLLVVTLMKLAAVYASFPFWRSLGVL